jgi:V8-like Glu-specific endopeptidase
MKPRGAIITIVPALLAVVCLQSGSTEAQENTGARLRAAVNASAPLTLLLSKESTEAQVAATRAYWTPARLASAQPMLPLVNATAVTAEAASTATGQPVSADGSGPTVTVNPDWTNRLYDPALAQIQPEAGGIEPQDVGSFGAHFTSARVNPPAKEIKYPNSPVGKLFFSIGTSSFVCSASTLRKRIVVTAGHCVHSGSGGSGGFHNNFLFMPAFRDGAAPFGTFAPLTVGTTTAWATGGGAVPNAADFGMFDMNDSGANRIGDITGVLGFQTNSLIPNHTTKLGYPCNLDACQKMQQVTSQSFQATSPNNVEYGSNARGGSSGGPWVMNFGKQPVGGLPAASANRLVGVTSYGYISTAPKVQGSSIPDNQAGGFIPLLNTMCALRVGNC